MSRRSGARGNNAGSGVARGSAGNTCAGSGSSGSSAGSGSVYELMRRVFNFSSYEDLVRKMIRQLSLLSPLGMDREPFMQLIECYGDKDLRESLLRLHDLHLVTIDPRTGHISMHPVLSDVAAAELESDLHFCTVMIANAVRYFDEDSAQRYDSRHLEQVSAMCMRCAMLLRGQKSGTSAIVSGIPPIAVRLSLAVSGIEYRLGNYRIAVSWAEYAIAGMGGRDNPALDSIRSALAKYWAEGLKCAARAYAKLGDYEKACEYYVEELELLPNDMRAEFAVALNDYGVLLEEMGRFDEAVDCLMSAWEIQKDLFGDDNPETISTCNNLGLICTDLGRPEEAETFYRHALRIALEYYKNGHPETAVMYSNLGELLMHSGERLAESRQYLTKALDIYTAAYGPSYPESACVLSNLGILEDTEGNFKKAREHYREALAIQSAVAGIDHPHCADILHNLGVSYIDEALEPFSSPEAFSSASTDQKRDALPLLRKALACEKKALSMLENAFGKSHSSVEMLRNEVEWLESNVGNEV